MKEKYSDQEIIAAVKEGGVNLEKVMKYLYREEVLSRSVMAFVQQMNGNKEDAEDVFQDSIIHLIMNIRKNQFRGESTMKTYFTKIAKNLWLQKYRMKRNRSRLLEEKPIAKIENEKSGEQLFIYKEQSAFVKQLLSQLGETCQKVLSFWGLSYSMKEIAEELGYKSEGMARKKKHQCMKQLIQLSSQYRNLIQE